MAFTFNSVGHFFAKAFKTIATAVPKVVAEIPKIEDTKTTVEAVTEFIPGGAAVVPLEDAAYAVLGEFASILKDGQAAASAKLADAGVDTKIIAEIEDLLKKFPDIVALAKAL